MTSAPAVPIRTCIGCRRRAPSTELVRLVMMDGRVVAVAPRAGLAGRGASIHPQARCVAAAVTRRAFGRAFRQSAGARTGPEDAAGTAALLRDIEVAFLARSRMQGKIEVDDGIDDGIDESENG